MERACSFERTSSLTVFVSSASGVNRRRHEQRWIIIPGWWDHRELWMDHEGYNLGPVAEAERARPIAAFVLKYRPGRAEPNSTYTIDDHGPGRHQTCD